MVSPFLSLSLLLSAVCFGRAFVVTTTPRVPESVAFQRTTYTFLASAPSSSTSTAPSGPTELPDSLLDAAERAAQATASYVEQAGPMAVRCRVDFDTSVGDETFPLLKTSAEFMQQFVSACCYAMIPGLQQERQDEMTRVIQAKAQLKQLQQETQQTDEEMEENPQVQELAALIRRQGRETENYEWKGPKCRVYLPDEGNAALARRDWLDETNPKVPPCVEFSSCSGVQLADISKDSLVFFFCPKASEAEAVERLLEAAEESCVNLQMTCLVNPNLVDMGVTGFGMAGRLLRERLIDRLVCTYYLRTLAWGALTRKWPQKYSVWQEDEAADGGYRLLQALDSLPSNPDVEDIYDLANSGNANGEGGGNVLSQLGDFMQGMMRL